MYLTIYIFTLLALMVVLSSLGTSSLSWTFNLNSIPFTSALVILLLFLSLGGMPPLWGFMAKISVMSSLCSQNFFYLLAFLIIGSLMNLYYYMTFCLTYFLSANISKKSSVSSIPFSHFFLCFPPIFFMPLMLSFVYS